jgi:hypothetical protein
VDERGTRNESIRNRQARKKMEGSRDTNGNKHEKGMQKEG